MRTSRQTPAAIAVSQMTGSARQRVQHFSEHVLARGEPLA